MVSVTAGMAGKSVTIKKKYQIAQVLSGVPYRLGDMGASPPFIPEKQAEDTVSGFSYLNEAYRAGRPMVCGIENRPTP